jgi:glycosyltransferase involved in cell wall biosynthesis
MRILYVLPSLLVGGAEAVVSQWARYLHRAGHSVEVCTLYTGGPFARKLISQGIRVHNLAHDPGIEQYRLRRKYDPRLLLALARLIRTGGYQLVHAHLSPALVYLAMVSLLYSQVPYLYSEHSVNNRRRHLKALKPVDRFLYSRYRQVLPVSEEVRQSLLQWLPALSEKIQVVPNTVDAGELRMPASREIERLRREIGLEPEEQVVLFAGRLVPAKGPDILVEALHGLALHTSRPVRALFAGDGPLRSSLEQGCAGLAAPVRATFLGSREDIPRLLALADLVVLPSRWEGLPMFLLEAMAAQKTILAAGVGGIPDAIVHQENGWLVPPDRAAAVAQGIAHLLDHPNLRRSLAESACQTFEARYAPDVAMGRLLQIYTDLLPEMKTG